MIARLPRPLAKLANFGPEFMGSVLSRPSAPPRTVTQAPLSTPSTPQATPRPPAIAPALPDAPTITPWTTADITPEPPAAVARPSSAPAKPTGKFKGFASRAQWRKFFADSKLRPFAHKKAHASKGGPKVRYRVLPERKGPPSAGSLR
jgi:hypothetical protein